MALVTKENIKTGLSVFACYSDPIDGCGYSKGVVTDVFDDHYLYQDKTYDIDQVWGFYDTNVEEDSVAVFTTEEDAKAWMAQHSYSLFGQRMVCREPWER